MRLYGQELDVLRREAEKVQQALAGVDGIVDPHVDVESREPVVEIEVNLEAAAKHGVKPGDVRRAAATLLAGIEVGNLFEEQKMFEVVVWGEPQVRHSVAAIQQPADRHPERRARAARRRRRRSRIVSAPNVIRRENVARTPGRRRQRQGPERRRRRGRRAAPACSEMSFPLEYRAELVGDFAKQEKARNRVIWSSRSPSRSASCSSSRRRSAAGRWRSRSSSRCRSHSPAA